MSMTAEGNLQHQLDSLLSGVDALEKASTDKGIPEPQRHRAHTVLQERRETISLLRSVLGIKVDSKKIKRQPKQKAVEKAADQAAGQEG
jgi:hypothetical protein